MPTPVLAMFSFAGALLALGAGVAFARWLGLLPRGGFVK